MALVGIVGDSLSAPLDSWVRRAAAELGAEVVGWPEPGAQTAAIGAQVDRVLRADPEVCVVLAGTNDALNGKVLRPALRVRAMWRRCRSSGARPIGATLPPYGAGDLDRRLLLTRWALNVLIRLLARTERVPVAALHRGLGRSVWAAGLAIDHVHPSPAGSRAMAERLTPLLRAALDAQPRSWQEGRDEPPRRVGA